MRHSPIARLACLLLFAAAPAFAARTSYDVDYRVQFLPDQGKARVSIAIEPGTGHVSRLVFGMDPARYTEIEGDGEIERSGDSVRWQPPQDGGTLTYLYAIDSKRNNGAYDARITKDWVIVRSITHLLGEQLRQALGLDIVHVPYGGGGPSIASVVAGHTQISFSSTPQVVPYVKDRVLRALAVVGKKRSRSLPETPTMIEAGFPQSEGDQWVGVLGPAGTHKDIVALLNREIQAAMALPEMQERFATLGYEVVGSSPEALTEQIRSDMDIWGKVIKAGRLKPG